MPEDSEITHLLAGWTRGDSGALATLTPLVYAELRRIADGYLRRERSGHTLQPTALVHEAWLRIANQNECSFEHRRQFFALAAQVMRRILVDHARTVTAAKRGGGLRPVTLDEATVLSLDRTEEFLALDEALQHLAAVSPRRAQVIEMRYFGGLNVTEIGELLHVSPATVSRDQRLAEAWLGHVLNATPAAPSGHERIPPV